MCTLRKIDYIYSVLLLWLLFYIQQPLLQRYWNYSTVGTTIWWCSSNICALWPYDINDFISICTSIKNIPIHTLLIRSAVIQTNVTLKSSTLILNVLRAEPLDRNYLYCLALWHYQTFLIFCVFPCSFHQLSTMSTLSQSL